MTALKITIITVLIIAIYTALEIAYKEHKTNKEWKRRYSQKKH